MITEIIRNTLRQIDQYEREYPKDARCLESCLGELKTYLRGLLLYIGQPTADDLREVPEDVDAPN